jgi:aquaporin Z
LKTLTQPQPKEVSKHQVHWPEYGAEFLGTAFLLLAGLSAVVLDFGAHSPVAAALPSASWRLLLTGLLFGGSGSLVAISPPGKLSGAHLNPMVTLGFWALGKVHHHDLFGYMGGQFAGATFGALLVRLLWRHEALTVNVGVTLPGAGVPLWAAGLGEAGATFALITTIFLFVSHHKTARWTPLAVWLLVAALVWQEAPLSGTSMNPARSFGPALVAWIWHDLWLYFVAPTIGMLMAVGAFRLGIWQRPDVVTAKLFHNYEYRTIFKNLILHPETL